MLTQEMVDILLSSDAAGWVMEPQAKQFLALGGIPVPRFLWTREREEAVAFARAIGYPVVVKVVSPKIVHKSDVGGVIVGISDDKALGAAFNRMKEIDGFSGIIVDEAVKGVELIVGAKIDEQFGPIVLLGIGGTTTEIYRDVGLGMAPLCELDVERMLEHLKAAPLLYGFRGSEPVDVEALKETVIRFSNLVMDLGNIIESIDLNPVICAANECVVADARIMLKRR